MKVEGTRSFAAARATVWDTLNDPQQMAELMPGVESFDVESARRWRANVKIPLGLGGLRMAIDFEKVEERAPEYARLHAKGTGVGALMNLDTEFHLSDEAEGTAMRWEADVRIAGPVGSMGQRVLQPIVNQQVQNVLTALDRQVMAAAGARPEGGGTMSGERPETDPELKDAGTPSEPAPGPMVGGGSEGGGTAGAPDVAGDAETRTDPELKDYGPPADADREPDPDEVEGSSGGEEGLNPWAPESYSEDPAGPTQSPDDRP